MARLNILKNISDFYSFHKNAIFQSQEQKTERDAYGNETLHLINGTWYSGGAQKINLTNFLIYNITLGGEQEIYITNSTVKNGNVTCERLHRILFVSGDIINSSFNRKDSVSPSYLHIRSSNIYSSKIESYVSRSDTEKSLKIPEKEFIVNSNVIKSELDKSDCIKCFIKNSIINGGIISDSFLVNCTVRSSKIRNSYLKNCSIINSTISNSNLKTTKCKDKCFISESILESGNIMQSVVDLSSCFNNVLSRTVFISSFCKANTATNIVFKNSTWFSGSWISGKWIHSIWVGGYWKTGSIHIETSHKNINEYLGKSVKDLKSFGYEQEPESHHSITTLPYIISDCNPKELLYKAKKHGVPIMNTNHMIFITTVSQKLANQAIEKLKEVAKMC